MAETAQTRPYEALPRVIDAGDDRWSAPQTAMLVTVVSAGLWALILLGVRWLIS
jgi:hypothetical protein